LRITGLLDRLWQILYDVCSIFYGQKKGASVHPVPSEAHFSAVINICAQCLRTESNPIAQGISTGVFELKISP
jgi:hypothetical protein